MSTLQTGIVPGPVPSGGPAPTVIVDILQAHAQRASLRRLARMLRVEMADAVQDAAVGALARIGTYRPERGPLENWLFIILRNAIVQARRDACRQLARALADPCGQLIVVPDRRQVAVLDVILAQEQRARIRALLAAADPFVQEVARLRGNGLTFREVAERLGVRSSQVAGRWFAWCRSVRKAGKAAEE